MKLSDKCRALIFVVIVTAIRPVQATAEPVEPITGNDIPAEFDPVTDAYDCTRREEMIPIRDGIKLFAWAKPADFKRATQRIHHSARAASFIELPTLRARREPVAGVRGAGAVYRDY